MMANNIGFGQTRRPELNSSSGELILIDGSARVKRFCLEDVQIVNEMFRLIKREKPGKTAIRILTLGINRVLSLSYLLSQVKSDLQAKKVRRLICSGFLKCFTIPQSIKERLPWNYQPSTILRELHTD